MAAPSIKDLNSSRTILGQKAASASGKVANNYDDCTFIIETVYEQTCYFDSPEDTEPAYCDEPVVISETIVDMICPSDPGDLAQTLLILAQGIVLMKVQQIVLESRMVLPK